MTDGSAEGRIIAYPRAKRLAAPAGARTVLLLQGPVGPFFDRLRHAFAAAGCNPVKINFNGGDWLYSHGPGTLNFRGDLEAWRDWLEGFIRTNRPEAIVLFGDMRPIHRVAVELADAAGVRVWCFEEGYLRPHYITMEPGGNNALSPLARAGDRGEEPDEHVRPIPFRGRGFARAGWAAFFYFVALFLGQPAFAGYRHHRNYGLVAEAVLWMRNGLRKLRNGRRALARLTELIEHNDKAFYVVALQVTGDMQLVHHGRGWTMERLVSETISAFARAGRRGDRLVFKAHPMDRGHSSHERFIREVARLSGVEDRVDFIDDGSIGLLIRHARGVVTVNSTSGFSAIHHGVPLLALGDASYGRSGLTRTGEGARDIEAFFTDPGAIDEAACRRFLAAVRRTSLLNGSYYLPAAAAVTCGNVIDRYERDRADRSAASGAPVPLPRRPDGARIAGT